MEPVKITKVYGMWIDGVYHPLSQEPEEGPMIEVIFGSDGVFHVVPVRDPDFPDVDPVTGDERMTTDENGDPL